MVRFLRIDDGYGRSYDGFQWKPVSEWTEAPDWNNRPECGGGLHGQFSDASGFRGDGSSVVLCETDCTPVIIDGDKAKVRRARIIARDDLKSFGPLEFNGNLNLSDTLLVSLPDKLKVNGYLNLNGCIRLTSLPKDLKVKYSLHLSGCIRLSSLPDDMEIGGYLDLYGCIGLTSLPAGLKVESFLDLTGCVGLTSLPDDLKVWGFIDLSGCKKLKSVIEALKAKGYQVYYD